MQSPTSFNDCYTPCHNGLNSVFEICGTFCSSVSALLIKEADPGTCRFDFVRDPVFGAIYMCACSFLSCSEICG